MRYGFLSYLRYEFGVSYMYQMYRNTLNVVMWNRGIFIKRSINSVTPKLMAKNLAGVFPTYQSMLRSWPGLTGMFDNTIVPCTLSENKRNQTVNKNLFNERIHVVLTVLEPETRWKSLPKLTTRVRRPSTHVYTYRYTHWHFNNTQIYLISFTVK